MTDSEQEIHGMRDRPWWQSAIIYEIYPRSFQDSNGDGVGDLRGILARLDYLVELGIDAIWIAPIFPSPMADYGYDVADYCGIDPLFGSMQDFDWLLEQAHDRNLKVILDFVPNHTSDQHPWFLESRSSRNSAQRDWYLWRDKPNNWMSNFGGSGWQWDETTQQYYYHSFLKEQPDLNWRNPAVRVAMYDVLRFWLAKGVDGFRVDVMWLMIKDDQYRDNPVNPLYAGGQSSDHQYLPVYNANRPEVHTIVGEMRAVIDRYPQRLLIGEIYLPINQLMTYYGPDLSGAHLPFNFLLLQTPWNATAVAETIASYTQALPAGAWPNWVLGNHDQARMATRVGAAQAAVAAMLLLTLPGTITMYYGEEIGMINGEITPAQVRDPAELRQPGIGLGRDPERTPMCWDASPSAGFTAGVPWLPVNADHSRKNVQALRNNPGSLFHLYRDLIALRRAYPVLVDGEIKQVASHGDLLTYERASETERILILLNLGGQSVDAVAAEGLVLLNTSPDHTDKRAGKSLTLNAGQGLILKIDEAEA